MNVGTSAELVFMMDALATTLEKAHRHRADLIIATKKQHESEANQEVGWTSVMKNWHKKFYAGHDQATKAQLAIGNVKVATVEKTEQLAAKEDGAYACQRNVVATIWRINNARDDEKDNAFDTSMKMKMIFKQRRQNGVPVRATKVFFLKSLKILALLSPDW